MYDQLAPKNKNKATNGNFSPQNDDFISYFLDEIEKTSEKRKKTTRKTAKNGTKKIKIYLSISVTEEEEKERKKWAV